MYMLDYSENYNVQSNPPNKGHAGTNVNYAVLSFVERLSSSQRFKMYYNYRKTNYLGL